MFDASPLYAIQITWRADALRGRPTTRAIDHERYLAEYKFIAFCAFAKAIRVDPTSAFDRRRVT
jgi:hypothetical protein